MKMWADSEEYKSKEAMARRYRMIKAAVFVLALIVSLVFRLPQKLYFRALLFVLDHREFFAFFNVAMVLLIVGLAFVVMLYVVAMLLVILGEEFLLYHLRKSIPKGSAQ